MAEDNEIGEEDEDDGVPVASMDLCEQRRTWRLFKSLVLWSVASGAALMLLLLLFRTRA